MARVSEGFRGPAGAGKGTEWKPGQSGNPRGRPRKFRALIEAGRATRFQPGVSGNPAGRPPNGVMTPTRRKRKTQRLQQEWRERHRRLLGW